MSKNTHSDSNFDFSEFDADPHSPGKRSISVPPPTAYPRIEQLSSGLDPIGQVRMEGRAFRGLSRGRMPWWVILTSWVAIALPTLILSGYVIYHSLQPLFTGSTPLDFRNLCSALLVLGLHLMAPSMILFIVARGTLNKFRSVRRQKTHHRSRQ